MNAPVVDLFAPARKTGDGDRNTGGLMSRNLSSAGRLYVLRDYQASKMVTTFGRA
jgi:hypothetical protein